MKLFILGTGTYQPELNKASACYLLKVDSKNIVIDFGRGAINRLLKVNVEYYEIDTIFITHLHADHCNDLSSFFHISLHELPNRKFRKKDLIIYGPIGLKNIVQHLLDAFNFDDSKSQFKIIVKELNIGEIVNIDNIKFQSFESNHSNNCFSYRIECNNKILSLSGDSGLCNGLINCIKNSDIAILESTISNNIESLVHLNPNTAIKIAKENNIKTLVLTHIGLDAFDDIKNIQDKNVIIAEDLMEFDI